MAQLSSARGMCWGKTRNEQDQEDCENMMTRRDFTKKIAAGLAVGAATSSRTFSLERLAGERRPNVVFLCSDQHNARYAGFAGHPFVKTPNLDRIARQGVVFSSAYCTSPLCVPGRSGMMTGMYPSDVNSFCNSTVYDGSYPTWGKMMRESGYYCWAVGKQDMNPAFDLGFVEAGVDHGHVKKPDITSLFRRPVGYRINEREEIDGEIHDHRVPGGEAARKTLNSDRDKRDTDATTKFLRSEAVKLDKPWVAFVGLREPHPEWGGRKDYFDYYLSKVVAPQVSIEELEQLPLPYQVVRNFKRISTPIPEERMRRAIAAYCSMVSELDECVGEIYRCLEELDQLEDTYFIYTSDHGESLGEHGMWLKNNLYEGAVHIPMIISGPGLPEGTIVHTPVSHVDLVATMLELAEVSRPRSLRGTSLVPLMEGRAEAGPHCVYSESHSEGNPTGSFMIRKGEWKLIHFSYYDDYLFNLKDDPEEKQNRINDPAAQSTLNELRSILRRQVDPEEVTERAFAAQEKILEHFVKTMNEDELFELFKSRLGDGQARIMAKMLKQRK